MEVYFGTVESAVALVYHIFQSQIIQSAAQTFRCDLPILIAAHAVLRTCRELDMILKTKQSVNLIYQVRYSLYLLANLLGRHEDVRVILSEAANAHKPVKLTGFFMTMYQTQLAHAQRQVSV